MKGTDVNACRTCLLPAKFVYIGSIIIGAIMKWFLSHSSAFLWLRIYVTVCDVCACDSATKLYNNAARQVGV